MTEQIAVEQCDIEAVAAFHKASFECLFHEDIDNSINRAHQLLCEAFARHRLSNQTAAGDANAVIEALWREGVLYGLRSALAAARGTNADMCQSASGAYQMILTKLRTLKPESIPNCYRPSEEDSAILAALSRTAEGEDRK